MWKTKRLPSYSLIIRLLERKMQEAMAKGDYQLADEYQTEAYEIRRLQLNYQKKQKYVQN